MEKQVVVMVYDKATKNKHVYKDEGSGPPTVSSLYIEKYVTGNNPPSHLRVTIEAA